MQQSEQNTVTPRTKAKRERESERRQLNADRSSYLKQKRKNAKRTLEEDRLAQLDMFRDDYESRIVQEDLLCQRTDALVAKMEKEETEPLNE